MVEKPAEKEPSPPAPKKEEPKAEAPKKEEPKKEEPKGKFAYIICLVIITHIIIKIHNILQNHCLLAEAKVEKPKPPPKAPPKPAPQPEPVLSLEEEAILKVKPSVFLHFLPIKSRDMYTNVFLHQYVGVVKIIRPRPPWKPRQLK